MREMLWAVGRLSDVYSSKMLQQELLDFAEMSAGAYGGITSQSSLFRFTSADGLSARVYGYKGRIAIAFKGATPAIWGYPFGPSANRDRKLVNNIFSRCETEKCKKQQREMLLKHNYFKDARKLLRQVVGLFPEREIVLTGHSLGGAIASVLAASTDGTSAVVFSTPGEIHLLEESEVASAAKKVLHFGLCNDPIYCGSCFGIFSVCRILNYRIMTSYHSGKAYCIEPETPGGIISHKINVLIETLRRDATVRDMDQSGCGVQK